MIIIELKYWYGKDEFFGSTESDFFYASFKNLKELKGFLDDKKKPIFEEVFSDDYHERITDIIYVCGDCVDSDEAEKIYHRYIDRIFNR